MILSDILLKDMPCVTRVRGHSMLPTLQDKRYYLYNPFVRNVRRGDIVTVDADIDNVVKRVIALEGDRVIISPSGAVTVNGTLLDEPYVIPQTRKGKRIDITVPKGCMWLMGDNRNASTDSRDFGAVERWRIKGRLIIKERGKCQQK